MEVRSINILILLVATVFMVSVFAAETQKDSDPLKENVMRTPEIPALTLSLSSDKTVYHSSEEMELRAMIESGTATDNLTVRVYGIKDSRGNFRVSGERVISVEPPGKTETFTFSMPSCYGCAGVTAGDYEITFEVERDGQVIGNLSETVKLEK